MSTLINFRHSRSERLPSGDLEITSIHRTHYPATLGRVHDVASIIIPADEAHELARFILENIPLPECQHQ